MRNHPYLLEPYGVKTVQELDAKDFGTYFLSKDITGQNASPRSAAASLYSNLQKIEEYQREMNRVREAYKAENTQIREKVNAKRRNERLFTVRAKSLVKKPDFRTRVADQCELDRDLFGKVGVLDKGKMMTAWEKDAATSPDRVWERKKWVPSDNVSGRQKHVYFQDTLKSVSAARRPKTVAGIRSKLTNPS